MTLREAIKKGLGEKYTKELEESLYWSVSEFMELVRENSARSYFKLRQKLVDALAETDNEP